MFCLTQGHPKYEGKLDDYFLKLYFIITNMNVYCIYWNYNFDFDIYEKENIWVVFEFQEVSFS